MSTPAESITALLESKQENAVALRAPDHEALSYGALARQVQEISLALQSAGYCSTSRIAVVLSNGPVMATVFLATTSFAVCAPLNPGFSLAECLYYLEDLAADAVIVEEMQGAAASAAQQLDLPIIQARAVGSKAGAVALQGLPPGNSGALAPRDAQEPALLLHTSGTTSRPKLVPLSQRNLLASAEAVATTLNLTPDDVALNVMPLFHIHGLVGVLLASLWAGGSVICAPGFSAETFMQQLASAGVTWYSAVPTIHQAALQALPERAAAPDLRFIRSSSAALPTVVLERLETAFGVPVIEAYGMTEAAHQMACNPLPPALRKAGSVGVAAGPQVRVIDTDGNTLAANTTGEIAIRGANVTSGYLANAEANREAFAGDWFRTGDQGYLDEDGYLYLTGRLKEIINRAGEKVAPREVDEALLQHPDVVQAVTFARPHATLGEDVLAAVVLREGSAATEQALRDHALAHLAAAKVPSQIVFVSDIPKGPTGKLQRIGLHEALAAVIPAVHAEPSGEIEETLAGFWRDLLNIDRVGRDDNFFFLGGDSLRAARVMSRILERYDVAIAPPRLFEQPTVRGLAGIVEAAVQARLEDLASYVASLSDEEVAKLLSESDHEA